MLFSLPGNNNLIEEDHDWQDFWRSLSDDTATIQSYNKVFYQENKMWFFLSLV